MENKCRYCGETKNIELFTKSRSSKLGVSNKCKICAAKEYKENYGRIRQEKKLEYNPRETVDTVTNYLIQVQEFDPTIKIHIGETITYYVFAYTDDIIDLLDDCIYHYQNDIITSKTRYVYRTNEFFDHILVVYKNEKDF